MNPSTSGKEGKHRSMSYTFTNNLQVFLGHRVLVIIVRSSFNKNILFFNYYNQIIDILFYDNTEKAANAIQTL